MAQVGMSASLDLRSGRTAERPGFGRWKVATALAFALGSLSCSSPYRNTATTVEWTGVGGTPEEQRYVAATNIDAGNVKGLGLAWSLDLPGEAALEATPLVVNGVMYFSGGMNKIYAVDAASGKQLWTYDPETGAHMTIKMAGIYAINRGLAYQAGKIFVATKDGRMIAVDAKTGKLVWSTDFFLPDARSTSTGAPRIAGNLVVIGNSGAESNARGYVTALDTATGKIAWRFYIVPPAPGRPPENDTVAMAAKTWSKDGTRYGGGGTAWNAIVYDEKFGQVLIGTGNASPYAGKVRGTDKGMDNLFVSSVVAVDAKTGAYKWHHQYNPGEVWDYKATADIILADLKIGGTQRAVLMQAPTDGFFYVIDRSNGKLLSAEKTGKVNWADRIDLKTGRPIERPGIRYENGPAIIYPGVVGGHDWQSMSYNPDTGLVYIPYLQLGTKFWHDKHEEEMLPKRQLSLANIGVMYEGYIDPKDPHDGKSALLAWDPVKQKAAWRNWQPTFWNGGTVTSGGNLVFQGQASGEFAAYNATTGQKLWSFDAKMGIMAAPITFVVKGKQYVSVLAGYGATGSDAAAPNDVIWSYYAPRRLLTFALDGKASLPKEATPSPVAKADIIDVAGLKLDPRKVAEGQALWYVSCGACHGSEALSRGGAPDLRASPVAADRQALIQVLRTNALVPMGMPVFSDLKEEQVDALYQYIRANARKAKSR